MEPVVQTTSITAKNGRVFLHTDEEIVTYRRYHPGISPESALRGFCKIYEDELDREEARKQAEAK